MKGSTGGTFMPAVSPVPQRLSDPHRWCVRGWQRASQIGDSAGMALSVDDLPDDVESLKALLLAAHAASEAADAKVAQLTAEIDRLTARAERLDHIVSVLRRAHFGRRSERISEEQIELALEDVEAGFGVRGCRH